ncbi:phosphoenolpyruvate hydrolase family protein [uncultured Leifsonia sp.]|uniref:phosphoenolpyruvate hydrolase family protein n=1 Tax=uncultured Leifsonia sp. TaxID=340359 RepID=UPI0028D85CD5|nr:phosphoenolpyruvate hydrolase family protein [uncultured Leifsonia sp.]
MTQFTRQQILDRLARRRAAKEPLVLGGAGIGLVAKAADRAGIDVLMAYNTGPFRMDGHGSLSGYLAYGDSNAMTIDLARHILPVVEDTPVVAGIGAGDPYRDTARLIDDLIALGYSGITNVPTAGIYDGTFRRHIDATDLGYPKEIDLVVACNRRDVFTIAYAFTPEEAAQMADAGADVIGAHVGLTVGGMIGAKEADALDDACDRISAMTAAARAIRPDVYVVAHGGAFDEPEAVQTAYDRTDVDGFLGASSIERLPVERAIASTVDSFRALTLRSR